MKGKKIYNIIKSQGILLHCIIPVAVFILAISSVAAQGFNQKYNVCLIGQVTNDVNGAPLKNHMVTIASDTANEQGFYYFNVVYTDHEGYYYDTILTNLEKGALIICTNDYQEQEYDTIVYYRFKWSESNILFANFVLPAPPLINLYQANFSYERNPTGENSLKYQFYDLTGSDKIISWNWDFDDGTHSNEQNPVHIFSSAGLYKVRLTVIIAGSIYIEPDVTTIVKIINVTTKTYFHMGGHVFADNFPIDKSEVFLYKIEGDDLVPIDTAMFNDTLGYFLFYQLIEGDYILKADLHPTSQLFNMFMTTYYSDKMHWDEADTIFHHSTNFEYNINLVPNNQAMAGPGKIAGEISYDASYGGGKSTPAQNVSILLYDEYNQAINICHSDQNGEFELDNLDLQMYNVYAEVTGKYTYPVEVVLEESNTGNTNVYIIIDENYVNGSVNSGVQENNLNLGLSDIFPNPADNAITLIYQSNVTEILSYSIVNYTGQNIQSSIIQASPGTTSLQIDVNRLNTGIYFIRFTNHLNQTATRKFIRK